MFPLLHLLLGKVPKWLAFTCQHPSHQRVPRGETWPLSWPLERLHHSTWDLLVSGGQGISTLLLPTGLLKSVCMCIVCVLCYCVCVVYILCCVVCCICFVWCVSLFCGLCVLCVCCMCCVYCVQWGVCVVLCMCDGVYVCCVLYGLCILSVVYVLCVVSALCCACVVCVGCVCVLCVQAKESELGTVPRCPDWLSLS